MVRIKEPTGYSILPGKEELKRDEARFWSEKTAPVPEDVEAALHRDPMDQKDILPFKDMNRLLDPGYHDVETGYGFCRDGVQYAACLTDMPGITAEMIDWWFAWHPLHDLRYRIWFPKGHYGTSVADPERCRDSRLPYRERYWHNKHTVIEDVGTGTTKLMILFVPPEEFGFDTSRFAEARVGTAVCANAGPADLLGGIFFTKMCHFVRETTEGVEIRSRFWIGQDITKEGTRQDALVNRFLNARIVKKRALPRVAHHVAHHCAAEYANLAQLLPSLFEEYRDRF
jgi:hypothetical protein